MSVRNLRYTLSVSGSKNAPFQSLLYPLGLGALLLAGSDLEDAEVEGLRPLSRISL
jgi:hypothetical protein